MDELEENLCSAFILYNNVIKNESDQVSNFKLENNILKLNIVKEILNDIVKTK